MTKEKEDEKGIKAKKGDTAEWYEQVCLKSGLADFGPVKGTMIIKPYGYAIWQKIQDYFNSILKKHNIKNAYFPMFIPESFFKKEAGHAKGFEPEVAWLAQESGEERIALRPTSETVIYDSFSKWIRSWRDLPFRINQWCNIVRWEVSQCKLFIRSREFLWQEGHCVYETKEQCEKEVLLILDEYEKLCKNLLAISVIKGKKSEKEKFAGALYTTTLETFTQEGKALQLGTSHNLGQGFAKSFNISFLDKNNRLCLPWQSSWGFSTRLIGAVVMSHSDNKGLILPPKIAPIQVIIIPIFQEENKEKIIKEAKKIKLKLKDYAVEVDAREEYTPGWKFNEYELKGVPIRIEIGPKDLKKEQAIVVRRDNGKKEAVKIIKDLNKKIKATLEDIQACLLKKSEQFLNLNIKKVKNWKEFLDVIKNKKMALASFCGSDECEERIKEKTQASSRCIPFKQERISGRCIHCNKPAKFKAYFSKSY